MRMTRTAIITAITLGGAVLAAPAYATINPDNEVQTRIKKADLETEKGVQKVYGQLRAAAERQCAPTGRLTLVGQKMAAKCEARLINDFVTDLRHDRLTAVHRAAIRKDS